MLSDVAHDTFVTYLDTATDTLAVFTSSAERLKSDEYGTLPSRDYFLALVQQHIPEGPTSLKEHLQKNLPTALARSLSDQLRDSEALSGPLEDLNAVMSKTVAQMRGTLAKLAPAVEQELSKTLVEVMAHRVELLLTNCGARLSALIQSHAAAQQRLWEL
jgi:hypothetical protein